MPPRGFVSFFGWFKETPGWALLIGLVNLVGIAYGFYYYSAQFAVTPWWLWPFVPDSPLAVLWAEMALVAYWLKRKPGVLDALAFVGNVQVGLWTVYALLAYATDKPGLYHGFLVSGGETDWLNVVLLFGHAGMAVLALIFLAGLRRVGRVAPRRLAWAIGVAAAYYLVNDALDYFGPDHVGQGCGLRPYTVPCVPGGPENALTAVTFGLTLFGVLVLAWVTWPRRGHPADATTE